MKIYQAIASAIAARRNCEKSGNDAWLARWSDYLERIESECLPSGSGFDAGTKIDPDGSGDILQFTTSFHHMDENGYYDGWTDHIVTVSPSLVFEFTLEVDGEDRNDICRYIVETFSHYLSADMPVGLVP